MAKQKKVMESEIIADDITRDCNSFEVWFIENGKKVAWACVAIVVIVAIVFSVLQIRKSARAKAYSALASAVTEQQLQDALKQYPNGTAAAEARFRLARVFIQAKNNKAALEQLALVAADEEALPFTRGRAILDTGYLYENDGKQKEALAQYEKAAADLRLPEDARLEGYYAAGRIQLQLKDFAKARTAFKQAAAGTVRSQGGFFWSSQARAALNRMPAEKTPAAKTEKK